MGQRQYFRVVDFSGGWNPDRNALLIEDNQGTAVQNLRLDEFGSLVARKGYDDYMTTAPPLGGDIVAMGRWDDPDNPDNSEVYVQTDDTNSVIGRLVPPSTFDSTSTLVGTTEPGQFVPAGDYLIFVNGDFEPQKINPNLGVDVTNLGNPAPVTAPVASATTGSLTGDYSYVYTYYNPTHGTESNASEADTITLSSEGASVTFASAPADTDANTVRIYRTTDGGSTHLRIAEVTHTTSPYVDSGDPDGSITVPTDHDQPPDLEHIVYHKGYAFGSIGNTLYWSKPLEIEYWPVLNQTEVPFEGGDEIQALVSFQDVLLVFGRRNTVVVAGSGGNWSLTRDDIGLGTLSHRTAVEVNHKLIVLTAEGLRVWPGYEPFAPQLDRTFSAMSHTTLAGAAMVYVASERSLYVSVNGQTYAIHVPNQAVSVYDIAATEWLEGGDDGFSDPLLLPTASTLVKQWGADTTDDGSDISIVWRSKPYRFTNPESTKHIRRLGMYATQGAAASATVVISDTDNTYTVVLDNVSTTSGSVWDTMEWNTDSWAGDDQIGYFIGSLPPQTLLGRLIQFTITAMVNEPLEIIPPITVEFRETNRFLGV